MATAPKKSPGRPVKNKELHFLLENAPSTSSNTSLNRRAVNHYLAGNNYPGCRIFKTAEGDEVFGPVWESVFYIDGKQRVIARGTLDHVATVRVYAKQFWKGEPLTVPIPFQRYFAELARLNGINPTLKSRVSNLEARVSQLEQRYV